jgi:FKBP-type peptidyl-prolyl cis-trans isomerase FkpA
MRLSAWTLTWLAITGGMLPLTKVFAANPQERNIPALLQFAERFQSSSIADEIKMGPSQQTKTKPAIGAAQNARPAAITEGENTKQRPGNWRIKDTEIKKQQEKIAGLEQEVSALRLELQEKETPRVTMPADLKGLSLFVSQVRRALSMTPDEKAVEEKFRQANVQVSTRLKAEQELRTQLESMKLQKDELNKALTSMKTHTEEQLLKSATSMKEQEEAYKKQFAELQVALDTAKANQAVLLSQNSLDDAGAKQNYAAGVSLGEEIMQMQVERNRWGVKTDKDLILAGIVDTFSGKRRLTDDILNRALTDAESEVNKARQKTLTAQVNLGKSYIEKFKQQKGVKEGSGGVLYKIDYSGDSPIPRGAMVDLIVKESLTDGTVIQDMEANGAVLSQKVADFPPLFQEALGNLNNHGSMTMVVPPSLAYGEKGYPPKIPPGATMVYQLRIAEIYPDTKKQGAEK